MSYTPPIPPNVHFAFEDPYISLDFNFRSAGYSPPSGSALIFNFRFPLITLDFEFEPTLPPPISKELLKKLCIRLHGQVYKYWVCYVRLGTQCVRRYWEYNAGHTAHLTHWQEKFRLGVEAWHNLSDPDKLHWRGVGVRKKKPITSLNAFLSAWMKDKI